MDLAILDDPRPGIVAFRPLADMEVDLTLTGGRSGSRGGGSPGGSDDGPGLGELKTPDWASTTR